MDQQAQASFNTLPWKLEDEEDHKEVQVQVPGLPRFRV